MVIGWKIHQSRKGRKLNIVLAVNNEVKGVCAAITWAFHMLCKACRLEQIFEIICIGVSQLTSIWKLKSPFNSRWPEAVVRVSGSGELFEKVAGVEQFFLERDGLQIDTSLKVELP